MNKAKLFLSGILLFSLSGCHALQQNLGMGFTIPDDKKYMPKKDKSDSLLGVDKNNNGVRDDVDQYIHNRMQSPEQIQSALMLARAIQEPLLIFNTSTSKEEVITRRNARSEDIERVLDQTSTVIYPLEHYKLFRTIQGLTYNTSLRRKANYAFSQCHFDDDCLKYIGR